MSNKTRLFLAGWMLAAGAAQAANIATSYNGATITNAVVVSNVADYWQQNGYSMTITNNGSVDVQSTSKPTNMTLGNGGTSTSAITIEGGALKFNGPNSLLIGNGSAGTGVVDLRSGSFESTPGATLFIGRDGGTGLVTIRGGSVTFGKQPSFDATAGYGSIDFADKIAGGTSDGTLTISGADEAYYEALYTAGDLTYKGDSSTYSFSQVFSVSGETLRALEPPETAAVITTSTTSGYAPLEVVFTGTNSTAGGTITGYSWTFGDGNTASGAVVTNTYSAADTYTAWLTISDDLGNAASNSVEITATFKPLELVATATPTEGEVPLKVVFDASGSLASGVGTITGYDWTFGDGNIGSGAIVTNTYMAVGTYTSEVVVVDSNGFSATNSMAIEVVPVRFVDFTTQVAGTSTSSSPGDAFPAAFTPAATNDLANVGQATLLSLVDDIGGIDAGQLANINDGATGTSGNNGEQVLLEAEDSFTIAFDTSVNTLGYDITAINTYAGWSALGLGRANQGYDVTVTFMDDTTLLISSGTYEPNATPNSWTAVYMTPKAGSDVIASGVKAITFSNFDEYSAGSTSNDNIAYREFDVLGTPTVLAEIGEVAIGVSGGQAVLSWESAVTCDVWTNVNLAIESGWGLLETDATSPVTINIGGAPQVFYELRY